MSRLVDAENYEYAVLLDDDPEGRKATDQLKDDGVSSGNILSVSDILSSEGDRVIEDLFSQDFFCNVVAEAHDVPLEPLQERATKSNKSIVESLDGELKRIQNISDSGRVIEKGEIAKTISENILEGKYSEDDIGKGTLNNFSELLSSINDGVGDGFCVDNSVVPESED